MPAALRLAFCVVLPAPRDPAREDPLSDLPFLPATPLIDKLESIFSLTEEEKSAIHRLPFEVREARPGETLLREGDRPSSCGLVVDGMVCRFKVLDEGRRQIMMFHTRGDIPNLESLHIAVMDHNVGALCPSSVAFVPLSVLRSLTIEFPRIAAAFWRDTLIDAAVFRTWLVNIGCKSAYARIAHLLCELVVRARAVGLGQDGFDHLPTQEEIGDALGLSNVHVNRTMRQLREDGLIVTRGRRLTVLDWANLQVAGEFDPRYLHLKKTV
jgi:CRP-like cAMP-binding protein